MSDSPAKRTRVRGFFSSWPGGSGRCRRSGTSWNRTAQCNAYASRTRRAAYLYSPSPPPPPSCPAAWSALATPGACCRSQGASVPRRTATGAPRPTLQGSWGEYAGLRDYGSWTWWGRVSSRRSRDCRGSSTCRSDWHCWWTEGLRTSAQIVRWWSRRRERWPAGRGPRRIAVWSSRWPTSWLRPFRSSCGRVLEPPASQLRGGSSCRHLEGQEGTAA